MKGDMLYAILVLMIAIISSILTGMSAQIISSSENKSGTSWSVLVLSILILIFCAVLLKFGLE